MKISGFSFVKNAIKFYYPVVESIQSVLPLVDEFIIAVGKSEDDTLNLIKSIKSDKIKIIETEWDESLREGGRVLAVETDKALSHVSKDSDWAIYIQGDEVFHEEDAEKLKHAMQTWKDEESVEGLLFNYHHFYGSYDYIGDTRRWYRNEIRIVRPNVGIYSYRDAQGFRKEDRKLNVKATGANVYHYGWVKPPDQQQEKRKNFDSLWHSDDKVKKMNGDSNEFDYSDVESLVKFKGTHPSVMQKLIADKNWSFETDISKKKFNLKGWMTYIIEKTTGYRIGEYKNYNLQ
jgi:hypothetical protein